MKPRFSYVTYTRPKTPLNVHALLASPAYEKSYTLDFETQCWIWQWQTNCGYPYLAEDGQTVVIHRELAREKFQLEADITSKEAGIAIRSCGNRLCVNPEHVVLRPPKARPARQLVTPLLPSFHNEVRALWRTGASINSLAKRYGTSTTEISKVVG